MCTHVRVFACASASANQSAIKSASASVGLGVWGASLGGVYLALKPSGSGTIIVSGAVRETVGSAVRVQVPPASAEETAKKESCQCVVYYGCMTIFTRTPRPV